LYRNRFDFSDDRLYRNAARELGEHVATPELGGLRQRLVIKGERWIGRADCACILQGTEFAEWPAITRSPLHRQQTDLREAP
jgi:hypothetical protein